MPPWLMSFLQMTMQNQNQQPSYDPLYGLPDAVRQSLMTQPSFSEGQVIPNFQDPIWGPEGSLYGGPQRTDPLSNALGMRDWSRENNYLAPPERSGGPYGYPASPPNPGWRGFPLGLY